MKIALITSHAYPVTKAGTENYVHLLAQGLKHLGHSPVVFTQDPIRNVNLQYDMREAADDSILLESLKYFNPDIIHFHTIYEGGFSLNAAIESKKLGKPTMATIHLSNNTCLVSDYRKFQETLCDGLMLSNTCTACLLSKKYKSPKIGQSFQAFQSLIEPLETFNKFHRKLTITNVRNHHQLVRKAFGSFDKVICLADWYSEVLKKNNLAINRIDRLPQIGPATKTIHPKKTYPKNILFAGRICNDKGINHLIEAWNAAKTDSLTLTFFGPLSDVNIKGAFLRFIHDNPNVQYHGEIGQQELLKAMKNYDVLVMPSEYEMAPLTILEAQSNGLAIIGSAAPGVVESCEKGWHINVESISSSELSHCFSNLNEGTLQFHPPKNRNDSISPEENCLLHVKLYQSLI